MQIEQHQLLAAQIATSNQAARGLVHEIVSLAKELSTANAADVAALACCLSPGKQVRDAVQRLRDGLADAAELIRSLPAAHAAAMIDLQDAFDFAVVRRQQIADEIEVLDRELAIELNAISRPHEEWNRWRRSGLTRNEIIQRGGIEPSTQDPEVLEAARQAARKKRDEAATKLVAERDALTRWRNTLDPRLMPDGIRDCWSPPSGLLKMLEGL